MQQGSESEQLAVASQASRPLCVETAGQLSIMNAAEHWSPARLHKFSQHTVTEPDELHERALNQNVQTMMH